jgi:hypothetical protein
MQYRIGDRDPVTGLYDVVHPDGSATRNGIKIFNSAHEFGDVVLATERSDGMMILDGVKATVTEVVTNSFGLGGFGEKPVGYLAGQVFNNEEEVILPTVSIEFAPGSPEELEPGAGDFVVRIKIDRVQQKDLRVKCELTGTAASGDYYVAGLDGDSIAIIPAGELYFDVVITPTQNQSGVGETVVVKVLQDRVYKINQVSSVTAIILAPTVGQQPYLLVALVGTVGLGATGSTVLITRDSSQSILFTISLDSTAGNPSVVTVSDLVFPVYFNGSAREGIDFQLLPPGFSRLNGFYIGTATIPVGSSSVDFVFQPIVAERGTTSISINRFLAANPIVGWNNFTLSPIATIENRPSVFRQFYGPLTLSETSADVFTFGVIRSITDLSGLVVNLRLSGTAINNLDYEIASPHVVNGLDVSVVIQPGDNAYILEIRPLNAPRQLIPSATIIVEVAQGSYEIDIIPTPIPTITQRPLLTYSTSGNTLGCPLVPGFVLTGSFEASSSGFRSYSYLTAISGGISLATINVDANASGYLPGNWTSLQIVDTTVLYPFPGPNDPPPPPLSVAAPGGGGYYQTTLTLFNPGVSPNLAAQRAICLGISPIESLNPGYLCSYQEIA